MEIRQITRIDNTTGTIEGVSVNVSNRNITASWVDSIHGLRGASLWRQECDDYHGAYSTARGVVWSPPTTFTTEPYRDRNLNAVFNDIGQLAFAIWDRDGTLIVAPQRYRDGIVSAQINHSSGFSSAATLTLTNSAGNHTRSGSPTANLFGDEKGVRVYAGYGDDLQPFGDLMVDSVVANVDADDGTLTINLANRYTDLLQLPFAKKYQPQYTDGIKSEMYSDWNAGSVPAADGDNIGELEVCITPPSGATWLPGSVSVAPNEDGIKCSRVWGQSTGAAYVWIYNTTDTPIDATLSVHAVRGTHTRTAANITMTARRNQTATHRHIFADDRWMPDTYRIDVADGWSRGGITYRASDRKFLRQGYVIGELELTVVEATANMINFGVEYIGEALSPQDISLDLVVTAQPTAAKGERTLTTRYLLHDIIKTANRKTVDLFQGAGTIGAGRRTAMDVVEIASSNSDERVDTASMYVVNTSNTPVIADIIDTDPDGKIAYIGICRVGSGDDDVTYSYQLRGRMVGKSDYFFPLTLDATSAPDIAFTAGVTFTSGTAMDAINKVLQVSIDDSGTGAVATYRNRSMHIAPQSVDVDHSVNFDGRSLSLDSLTIAAPRIVDSVNILGTTYPAEELLGELTMLHRQKAHVGKCHNRVDVTVQIPCNVDTSTYELRTIRVDGKGHCYINRINSNAVRVAVINDSSHNLKNVDVTFELWGRPSKTLNYREQYIYQTLPGASGRYTYSTATVTNELIDSAAIADNVGLNAVLTSVNQCHSRAADCIGHPEIEAMDTVCIDIPNHGTPSRYLVGSITHLIDADEYTTRMDLTPFDRFAIDSFAAGIDATTQDISDNTEVNDLASALELIRMLFN